MAKLSTKADRHGLHSSCLKQLCCTSLNSKSKLPSAFIKIYTAANISRFKQRAGEAIAFRLSTRSFSEIFHCIQSPDYFQKGKEQSKQRRTKDRKIFKYLIIQTPASHQVLNIKKKHSVNIRMEMHI